MKDTTYVGLVFILGFGLIFATAILSSFPIISYKLFFEVGIVLYLLYILFVMFKVK